jgi:DNA-binding TFAR19-related protein (PDSD5 family)
LTGFFKNEKRKKKRERQKKKKVMKDKYQYNQKDTSEPDKSSDAIIRQILENSLYLIGQC